MPTTAENEYQDKLLADFDIQIVATQFTHESDAFDNQYDKDACLHSAKKVIAGTPATCTTPGLTQGVNCARCDTVIVAQVETPLAEHTESDWIVDTPAGEGVEGSKHTECADCHVTITTENIPALPTSIFRFAYNGDGTYTVTGLKSGVTVPENLEIPSEYNNCPVTAIGDDAFSYKSFTSVTIPEGVTTIGGSAFYGCSNLQTISVPNSITYVGSGAFDSCDSLQYNVFDNARYLGNDSNPYVVLMNAIDTSITSCDIHDNTKVIYHSAFNDCDGLTNIDIPNNVTQIGVGSFFQCLLFVY